jgi:opacity protein-like surface antigen
MRPSIRNRLHTSIGVVALLLAMMFAGATDALAQSTKPRRQPPPPPLPRPTLEIGGYGMIGLMNFTAADSFDVIVGSPSGMIFGGGARVNLPYGGLFVDVGAWRFGAEGERTFIFAGEEFDLGIPVEVTVIPVEFSAGWQFRLRRALQFRPYVGGGFSSYGYRESSKFATDAENVDERFSGFHLLGGAEYRVSRIVALAGEATWTTVPDALGEGGVSAAFDETDLGGISFRLKVIIGR